MPRRCSESSAQNTPGASTSPTRTSWWCKKTEPPGRFAPGKGKSDHHETLEALGRLGPLCANTEGAGAREVLAPAARAVAELREMTWKTTSCEEAAGARARPWAAKPRSPFPPQ